MEYITEKNGKRRAAHSINCEFCGKEYLTRSSCVTKFCSPNCSSLSGRKRIKVTCAVCGSATERTPSKFKKSKSGVFFCDIRCMSKARTLKVGILKPPNYSSERDSTSTYRYRALQEVSYCVDCAEDKRYLLVVHHIDGDRCNNVLANLEVLCANCHIKRHLVIKDGEWVYNSATLTDRTLLTSI